jgi:hypothetical protein
MHETPAAFNESLPRAARAYPADDLSGFRWHTGATPRPLAPEEPCPVLFRDIGPAALALFLRGQLPRLAGPLSPLVYMRTAEYVEPYTDHERTGRLLILRPLSLHPWHSGVPHICVARARPGVDAAAVGFVPGEVALTAAARMARELTDTCQWRAALGVRFYDEAVAESLHALDRLAVELARAEELAAPLRGRLQSADRRPREQARAEMERIGLTEADLCTAWHHLPRDRRGWIAHALRRVDSALTCPCAAGPEKRENSP